MNGVGEKVPVCVVWSGVLDVLYFKKFDSNVT